MFCTIIPCDNLNLMGYLKAISLVFALCTALVMVNAYII